MTFTHFKNMINIGLLVLFPSIPLASDNTGIDNTLSNATTNQDIKRFLVQGEFFEIKDFLLQSIAGRGIKISSTSYIGKMLKRTREDVGGNKDIYKNAEAIGFCSASLSRQMMESDPHHIVFCPYTIVIYELAALPGSIYLAYRRPFYRDTARDTAANDNSLEQIDTLLSGIVKEVVE